MAIVSASDTASTASLTDLAYQRIEEEIVMLRLEPGSIVSEAQLSALAGIGRTPIREALQRLAHAGLVVVLPRRGILISEIDIRAQLQLLEVRREVERLVAGNAAERATVTEKERFLAIADEMRRDAETDDDRAFLRLDRELNDLSVDAARKHCRVAHKEWYSGLTPRDASLYCTRVARAGAPAPAAMDAARPSTSSTSCPPR